MAKPTFDPEWATDATYPAGADPWSGNSNKVDPGASRQAEGYVPDAILPAEWLNFNLGGLGEWAKYVDDSWDSADEHRYPDGPQSRVTVINPLAGFPEASTGTGHSRHWITEVFSTPPTEGYRLTSQDNSAVIVYPLNHLFPHGAILTGIDIYWQPGQTTGGGRTTLLRAHLFVSSTHYGVPSHTYAGPLDSTNSTDTTTDHVTSLAWTSNRTILNDPIASVHTHYNLRIVAGDDAGTNRDHIMGIRVNWTDAGLRNY